MSAPRQNVCDIKDRKRISVHFRQAWADTPARPRRGVCASLCGRRMPPRGVSKVPGVFCSRESRLLAGYYRRNPSCFRLCLSEADSSGGCRRLLASVLTALRPHCCSSWATGGGFDSERRGGEPDRGALQRFPTRSPHCRSSADVTAAGIRPVGLLERSLLPSQTRDLILPDGRGRWWVQRLKVTLTPSSFQRF